MGVQMMMHFGSWQASTVILITTCLQARNLSVELQMEQHGIVF